MNAGVWGFHQTYVMLCAAGIARALCTFIYVCWSDRIDNAIKVKALAKERANYVQKRRDRTDTMHIIIILCVCVCVQSSSQTPPPPSHMLLIHCFIPRISWRFCLLWWAPGSARRRAAPPSAYALTMQFLYRNLCWILIFNFIFFLFNQYTYVRANDMNSR